jgi:hypothetical protein
MSNVMIDPASGAIVLDARHVFRSGMPEQDFVNSSIGRSARSGPTNAGYQWYYVELMIDAEQWSVSLCFHDERLETVSMSPVPPYDSWADFSEEHERQTAGKLRTWLSQWLGREPSRQLPLMDVYDFPWGIASAGVVPQDATASLGVHYAIS